MGLQDRIKGSSQLREALPVGVASVDKILENARLQVLLDDLGFVQQVHELQEGLHKAHRHALVTVAVEAHECVAVRVEVYAVGHREPSRDAVLRTGQLIQLTDEAFGALAEVEPKLLVHAAEHCLGFLVETSPSSAGVSVTVELGLSAVTVRFWTIGTAAIVVLPIRMAFVPAATILMAIAVPFRIPARVPGWLRLLLLLLMMMLLLMMLLLMVLLWMMLLLLVAGVPTWILRSSASIKGVSLPIVVMAMFPTSSSTATSLSISSWVSKISMAPIVALSTTSVVRHARWVAHAIGLYIYDLCVGIVNKFCPAEMMHIDRDLLLLYLLGFCSREQMHQKEWLS